MQPHDHSPLTDFIKYPEEQMLTRSEEFLKPCSVATAFAILATDPLIKR